MQEILPRLDDLSSLQSFGHLKLESVKGDHPIGLDLLDTIVDNLPNGSALTNLDEYSLGINILFKHKLV